MRRTFELLVSSVQNQVGWSVFLVLYPGQHYVCVCVRVCFHIVLHVSGRSGIQIPSLEHMLASLSLFVSYLLVLARLWCFLALDFVHVSVDS